MGAKTELLWTVAEAEPRCKFVDHAQWVLVIMLRDFLYFIHVGPGLEKT